MFPASDLRLIANLSARVKASGRLVSLVPPQSYLDATTTEFSLRVNLSARCWHPEFSYAGRSVYAALLALAPPATFDLVSIQLYESWSLAACALYARQQPASTYLAGLVKAMDAGWKVGFDREPSLGLANATVRVPARTLVLGVANGWTRAGKDSKALFVPPDELGAAWKAMVLRPRGFMFWDAADEGHGARPGIDPPVYMARGLNAFLHTRAA